MKKLLIAAALLACAACTPKGQAHPDWTYNSVVYEVNVRQFSPESSFAAVQAQLPRLKDLGVDILWFMPIYPIGVEGRKGTLGSYYSISDYKAVNPEFGTMEDFENLLAAAHEMGFKVVLDWVANHTSPDNVWLTQKPANFYERDAEGNTVYEYDWSDTRNLNYDNKEVWWAQEDAMRFWLEKGVDGFRCDAASTVPDAFWKGILPKMKADYPQMYLLAEAEDELIANPLETFDAHYSWELHHLLNSMAQGAKGVQDLKDYVAHNASRFPKEAFRLTFTSNHDENSWAGTEFEREGAAANACAVLCATLPGSQLLVYTGQEIGLDRRLEFFEKDPITDWSPNEYTAFWKKLIELKHENPALAAGERGGEIVWWEAPEDWVAFHRELNGNMVIVLASFGHAQAPVIPSSSVIPGEAGESPEANDNRPAGDAVAQPFKNLEAEPITMTFNLPGEYLSVFDDTVITEPTDITLAPGEFKVFVKK